MWFCPLYADTKLWGRDGADSSFLLLPYTHAQLLSPMSNHSLAPQNGLVPPLIVAVKWDVALPVFAWQAHGSQLHVPVLSLWSVRPDPSTDPIAHFQNGNLKKNRGRVEFADV